MNGSGAGGRTRTGTDVSPEDFESATSANSITPACSRSKENFNTGVDGVSIQPHAVYAAGSFKMILTVVFPERA